MDFEDLDTQREIDGRRWQFWAYPHAEYTRVFVVGLGLLTGEAEVAGYTVNVAADGTIDTRDREVPENLFPHLREVAAESRTPERISHNVKVLEEMLDSGT